MKRLVPVFLFLTVLAAPPAHATPVPTFGGSCVLRGDDVFTPALTMQPRVTGAVADVAGTCRGTLTHIDGTAKKLSAAPARMVLETSSSSLSCAGGALRGAATLSIDGTRIPMNVLEPQVTAATVLLISGPTTGRANGLAYADERTDLIGTVQTCLGDGVTSVPITLSFTTLTPIG